MSMDCASPGAPHSRILDAEDITAMRTAAASAIATQHLAIESPRILTILGSGVQARSHLKVFTTVFSFQQVRIWNIRKASAMKLVEELKVNSCSVTVVETVEDAVRDADVIVTATLAEEPILYNHWVKPGAHINVVGAPMPYSQEIDCKLMLNAVVYVDSRDGALSESGDIIISKAPIYAELGEVVLGHKEAFRNKTTVFKSLGMAIQDAVTARLIYNLHSTSA